MPRKKIKGSNVKKTYRKNKIKREKNALKKQFLEAKSELKFETRTNDDNYTLKKQESKFDIELDINENTSHEEIIEIDLDKEIKEIKEKELSQIQKTTSKYNTGEANENLRRSFSTILSRKNTQEKIEKLITKESISKALADAKPIDISNIFSEKNQKEEFSMPEVFINPESFFEKWKWIPSER